MLWSHTYSHETYLPGTETETRKQRSVRARTHTHTQECQIVPRSMEKMKQVM